MAGAGLTAVDVSRLITGLRFERPTGIERMELGYATRLDDRAGGVVVTPAGPRLVSAAARRAIAGAAAQHWREAASGGDTAAEAAAVFAFVDTGAKPARRTARPGWPLRRLAGLAPGLLGGAWRTPECALPQGARYLHAGLFRLERPDRFDWLSRRRDVAAAFMIYDLLPIEHPDFFRAGEDALHRRRLITAARHGRALLVPAATVGAALRDFLEKSGTAAPPILTARLPTEDAFRPGAAPRPPGARPYFLCCGTIEPRKNHALLLAVWRRLAAELGDAAPRLVIAGRRGWRNEAVFAALDAPGPLARLVLEAPGLTTAALALLMRGAEAVLSPSFAEGFGLPVAEALACGTPVIAADTPIYRELWGGRVRLVSPHDVDGWTAAIAGGRAAAEAAQLNPAAAHAMTWAGHIDRIEGLLAAL